MASLICRRNRFLRWLALVLTVSLVLLWFNVGSGPREKSWKGIGQRSTATENELQLVAAAISKQPHSERDWEITSGHVLKSNAKIYSRPTQARTTFSPSVITQEAENPKIIPGSNIGQKSNAMNHTFHPARRKITSIQNSRSSDKHTDAHRTGYVTSLDFWDQQTFSVQNILTLQAWAGWLGVSVLEPFLMGTKFGLPLGDYESFHSNGSVSYLAMSDVYDTEQWNLETSEYHYKMSPLIQWKDFLSTALRDVLFFHFGWLRGHDNEDVTPYKKTLAKLGFRLVEAHNFGLNWRKTMTETDLKAEVYKGGKSPADFTVIFSCWSRQQFTHVFRELHLNMLYGNSVVSLAPSRKLKEDSEQYRLRHMSPNGSYIGVLVRSEWLIMNRAPNSRKDVLNSCLNRAVGWLGSLKNQTSLSDVFVGMDIGRFGSTTLEDLQTEYVERLGENFLRTAYNDPQMTLQNWEETFTGVSTSGVPGYVAFLQKMVAANGKCLLLVGFGSFQRHALQMYMKLHRKQDFCYLMTGSQCRVKSVVGFDP